MILDTFSWLEDQSFSNDVRADNITNVVFRLLSPSSVKGSNNKGGHPTVYFSGQWPQRNTTWIAQRANLLSSHSPRVCCAVYLRNVARYSSVIGLFVFHVYLALNIMTLLLYLFIITSLLLSGNTIYLM